MTSTGDPSASVEVLLHAIEPVGCGLWPGTGAGRYHHAVLAGPGETWRMWSSRPPVARALPHGIDAGRGSGQLRDLTGRAAAAPPFASCARGRRSLALAGRLRVEGGVAPGRRWRACPASWESSPANHCPACAASLIHVKAAARPSWRRWALNERSESSGLDRARPARTAHSTWM